MHLSTHTTSKGFMIVRMFEETIKGWGRPVDYLEWYSERSNDEIWNSYMGSDFAMLNLDKICVFSSLEEAQRICQKLINQENVLHLVVPAIYDVCTRCLDDRHAEKVHSKLVLPGMNYKREGLTICEHAREILNATTQ